MTTRVVVTGFGIASPIGNDVDTVVESLRTGRTGVVIAPGLAEYRGIRTRLAGVTPALPIEYPRKRIRGMGRVGVLSLWASDGALADAGLAVDSLAGRPDVGLAYGSTHGSSSAMEAALGGLFTARTFEDMPSSSYLKFMSHTTSANLAIAYGIRGRVIPTCSACTSGSQAIGFAYEAIRRGQQRVMICGGAEELHPIHVAVFDVMYATSTRYNDRPELAPRPYDRDRDGLVVGEGAATLVLESLEHAEARGARIHGEVLGFSTNCDGVHATAPSVEGMAAVMRLSLADAAIGPMDVDWVDGHGTATEAGDIAETQATAQVFGSRVAISAPKSYMGHTLGACGAIESVISLLAIERGFLPPTRNLAQVDERCAELDYVTSVRESQPDIVMNNNFAFGGINTSLIFGKA